MKNNIKKGKGFSKFKVSSHDILLRDKDNNLHPIHFEGEIEVVLMTNDEDKGVVLYGDKHDIDINSIKDIVYNIHDKNKRKIKEDVCLNFTNFPFITLTSSKIGNTWYHDELDYLFTLTSRGFKIIKGGSKNSLIKNNLL